MPFFLCTASFMSLPKCKTFLYGKKQNNAWVEAWKCGLHTLHCYKYTTQRQIMNKSKNTHTQNTFTSNNSPLRSLVYFPPISDDWYLPTFVSLCNCVLCTARCPQCEYTLAVAWICDLTKIYLSTMFLTIVLQGSLGETLREVKPTFFFGVPRYPLPFTVYVHAQRC